MRPKVAIAIRVILMVVAVAIFVIGLCLTLTPFATKVAASEISSRTNKDFQYASVSGVLYGPITFKDVSYTRDGYTVTADTFTFETSLSALIKKRLQLDYIKADNIRIQKNTSTPTTSQATQKALTPAADSNTITKTVALDDMLQKFKYSLNVEKIALKNITYAEGSKTVAKLKQIDGHVFLSKDKIDAKLQTALDFPKQADFSIQVNGRPDDYQTQLTLNMPDFTASADGKGTLTGIDLNFAQSEAVTGNLQVTWLPKLQWHTNIQFDKVPVSLPHSKKKYTASAIIMGKGEGNNGEIALTNLNIPANKTTITGSGKLQFIKNQKPTLALNIKAGDNRIDINGTKTNDWSVKWDINLPDINSIYADGAGTIKSTGAAYNISRLPHTDGKLTVKDLNLPDLNVKNLNANWSLDWSQKAQLQLKLNFNDIQYKKIVLNKGDLTLSGNLLQQRLKIAIDSPYGDLTSTLVGGVSLDGYWVGNLYNTQFQSSGFGTWKNAQTPAIKIGRDFFTLPKTCFDNSKKGLLCLTANWDRDTGWQLDFTTDKHQLGPLAKLINPDMTVDGEYSLSAKLKGQHDTIDSGQIQLTMPAGKLSLDNDTEKFTQAYKGGEVDINISPKGTAFETHFAIDNQNIFAADLHLPDFHTLGVPPGTQKITGDANLTLDNIRILSAFIPDAIKTSGKLRADLELEGTLATPEVSGDINLNQASVYVPSLNTTFRKANLNINGEKSRLEFSGKVYSGDSPINISGYTHLDKPGLPTRVNLSGNNILIMDTPQYQLYVTPDLRLDIKNKTLWVHGDIYLPKGVIKPEDTFDTVTLPDDVVIVSNQDVDTSRGWQIGIEAKVTAGNEVIYDADGINGRIEGSLDIFKKPNSPMLANGQLNMIDGLYQAHAIKLKIAQGELNFHNSPVNNPNLNIRAVRVFTNNDMIDPSLNGLTVGVEIQGSAKRPKTKLFSSPIQLADVDILSYIMFGQSINPYNSLTSADTGVKKDRNPAANIAMIVQAANALTPNADKAGSQSILGKIQSGLGLQELGIEDSANIDPWKMNFDDQSALVAGKYITPKLYVRYARDLNDDNSNNVLVRYRLTKNFALQAGGSTATDPGTSQSTNNQGVDLIYTFTRK